MIVTDEDYVNRRQILESDAGCAVAFRTGPRDRANALGILRIRQDIKPIHLDEERRMINKSNPQSIYAFGERRLRRIIDPNGPGVLRRIVLIGKDPADEPETDEAPWRDVRCRLQIVKLDPIEMAARGPLITW